MIQRETGGNLAEILEKVAYTIRERFRIMGDLKTLTTSSRMSAWLLVRSADIRDYRHHRHESGLHERALEGPARPLPDRDSDVPAGNRHADRAKNSEDKNLKTGQLSVVSGPLQITDRANLPDRPTDTMNPQPRTTPNNDGPLTTDN